MIRQINKKDTLFISEYLSKKLSISNKEANSKISKLIKSGLPAFIKEGLYIDGICWVEIDDKKVKRINFQVDNWKIAEDFIKVLKWNLNGDYIIELPKYDFLNKTLNKNGFKFFKVENNKNYYTYKFEKRVFYNTKSDDNI